MFVSTLETERQINGDLRSAIKASFAPSYGRFLQVDPVGYDDDINLYAYVANDPVNFRDRTGMRRCGPRCWETDEPAVEDRPDVVAPAAARQYAAEHRSQVNVRDSIEAINTNEKFSAVVREGEGFRVQRVGTRGARASDDGETIRSEGTRPPNTEMVMHGHFDTIVPGELDDSAVIQNGLANGIENNGRFGVVEFVDGRFRYSLDRGRLATPEGRNAKSEQDRIQDRLDEFQRRLRQ